MSREIEAKYLLWENGLEFTTPAFLELFNLDHLRLLVNRYGVYIEQGYLDLETGINLARALRLDPDFIPTEFRLRKEGQNNCGADTRKKVTGQKDYYLTAKDDGLEERGEAELKIEERIFQKYWDSTAGKRIRKSRLKHSLSRFKVEFDLYADRDLILAEIEVRSKRELETLVPLGRDVTTDSRYKNYNLAR